jgi:hypothetical protein
MAAKEIKPNSNILVEECTTENVIFACTTLNTGSTISDNFPTINETIRKLIKSDIKINPFFIYKRPVLSTRVNDLDSIDSTTLELLSNANYNTKPYNLCKENIIDCLRTIYTKDKALKFKIIVLSQCSDLVSTLTKENTEMNKTIFETIYENLYAFYDKMNDDSYIINYYYDNFTNLIKLVNIEQFTSYITINNYIIIFLYSIIIFKILFADVSIGIYKKINKIDILDFYIKCTEIKNELIEKLNVYFKTVPIQTYMKTTTSIPENFINFLKKITQLVLTLENLPKNINLKNLETIEYNDIIPTNILSRQIKKIVVPFITYFEVKVLAGGNHFKSKLTQKQRTRLSKKKHKRTMVRLNKKSKKYIK